MKRFEFHLSISPETYLDYYRGTLKHVIVQGRDGFSLQFPASLLTPFVTRSGIYGDFVLTCDDQHRGAELHRLDSAPKDA